MAKLIEEALEESTKAKRAHTNLGDLQVNLMLKGWNFAAQINETGDIAITFVKPDIEKMFTLTGTSLLSIFKRATDAITVLEP
jgi:hypothetical protein